MLLNTTTNAAPFFAAATTAEQTACYNAALKFLQHYTQLTQQKETMLEWFIPAGTQYTEHAPYPDENVIDMLTGAQYYYHDHDAESPYRQAGEHGHVHVFFRRDKIPPNFAKLVNRADAEVDTRHVTHVIAIALDGRGLPVRLFTVNRWVTDEAVYPAAVLQSLLSKIRFTPKHPWQPVNTWLTALLRFYRPQIKKVLAMRDENMRVFARQYPDRDIFEARDFEITAQISCDVATDVTALQALMV